jgi:hypothetical protein
VGGGKLARGMDLKGGHLQTPYRITVDNASGGSGKRSGGLGGGDLERTIGGVSDVNHKSMANLGDLENRSAKFSVSQKADYRRKSFNVLPGRQPFGYAEEKPVHFLPNVSQNQIPNQNQIQNHNQNATDAQEPPKTFEIRRTLDNNLYRPRAEVRRRT